MYMHIQNKLDIVKDIDYPSNILIKLKGFCSYKKIKDWCQKYSVPKVTQYQKKHNPPINLILLHFL